MCVVARIPASATDLADRLCRCSALALPLDAPFFLHQIRAAEVQQQCPARLILLVMHDILQPLDRVGQLMQFQKDLLNRLVALLIAHQLVVEACAQLCDRFQDSRARGRWCAHRCLLMLDSLARASGVRND